MELETESGLIRCLGDQFPWTAVSEQVVTIDFGLQAAAETVDHLAQIVASLEARPPAGIVEWVPGYCTLTLWFDRLVTSPRRLMADLEDTLLAAGSAAATATGMTGMSLTSPPLVQDVPVCYGGVHGPDLDWVANHLGVGPQQVIDWHSGPIYRVDFIGFSPGFPYLSGLDTRLTVPRLSSPRVQVPAGSIAIAGVQAGIYPASTPGGWRLLGWTPLQLFSVDRRPPSRLKVGDRVRFRAISPGEAGFPGPFAEG